MVQLKVSGFWVEDGAHQLPFLCAEACGNTSMIIFVGSENVQLQSVISLYNTARVKLTMLLQAVLPVPHLF